MSFDPYHEWLGIPPSEQPPNHYRLLGIAPFESDPNVISQAAEQRTGQIRGVQSGQLADLAQRILNEIAGAKLCLLDPNIKRAYDASLGKRSPPPLPQQTAEPPAKSRTVKSRRSPNLVALIMAGVALALMTGAGAVAIWWLKADSQQARPKDLAVLNPPAVVDSHDKASPPSSSKQVGEPAENQITNVAPNTPEPSTTPEPITVVPPPVVTPPTFSSLPAEKPDSTTIVRVQKGKVKKKVAKKSEKPGHKWKPNAAGYPTMAGTWSGVDGHSITVVQQRDQLTATGISTDSQHNDIHWRWSGTIDKEGRVTGRLVYSQASSDLIDRDAAATLSPDGKTIRGPSGGKAALPDLPWKKAKPPGKKK